MEENKIQNNVYSSFLFFKLLPEFRKLVSNEKIAAKQEFENMIGSCQEKVFLRTYFITGLKSNCDILFWRMSENLDYLQEMCARTMGTGFGKYLEITHSYIGVYYPSSADEKTEKEFGSIPKNSFGIHRYMLLHPLVKSQIWYEMTPGERDNFKKEREEALNAYPDIKENFFLSYGIDDQDVVVVREAKKLDNLIKATRDLRKQRIKNFTVEDKPAFLCVGRDLREILDNLS